MVISFLTSDAIMNICCNEILKAFMIDVENNTVWVNILMSIFMISWHSAVNFCSLKILISHLLQNNLLFWNYWIQYIFLVVNYQHNKYKMLWMTSHSNRVIPILISLHSVVKQIMHAKFTTLPLHTILSSMYILGIHDCITIQVIFLVDTMT